MADVFISYSRRDGEFVRELHAFLTGGGRDVWVDWEDIPPASQWAQDIDESIDAAESVVFVVSGSSLGSEYCLAELRHALERGKRIVPLACDGADPGAAPEGLRQLNWIWCRDGDDHDEAFAKLTRALDTDLEWAKAHTRMLVRAVEWEARQDASLLLRGSDLEEAAQQVAVNAGKEPVPTELQHRYVLASRRAGAKRQRIVLGGISSALVVSVALGVLALLQRNDARRATRAATSVALASAANDRVASKPDQALLLALAAYDSSPSAEARNAAVTALEAARKLGVTELLHGDAEVRSVAFAPDGRTLAVGGADGAVRLWDVRARKQVAELTVSGSQSVVSVDFARNGRVVAVGSADGVVRLWDVESRRQVGRVFSAHGAILATAVSADAGTVAAIAGAGSVWLWDVRSGSMRRLRGPRGDHAMLAFSPDGRTLAAGATDTGDRFAPGTVRLWDVASGKALGDLPSDDSVEALAFAPDGRRLVTGGYVTSGGYGDSNDSYGELRLWDVRRLATVRLLKSRFFVDSVAFAPDGRRVAAGRSDGSIQLAAPEQGKWVGSPLRASRGVTNLAFSRDGHTIAAAVDGDTTVQVWDLHDRARFGRPIGSEDGDLENLAFSPDGRTVAAAGGYRNAVHLVSVGSETSRVPSWLRARDASAQELAFTADGSILAARNDNGSVQLWDLRTRRPAGRLPAHGGETFGALAFDRAGDVLAAGADEGTLRFWDVRHRRLLGRPLHTRGVLAAAFVDGGRTLVTAAGDGSVELWDVARAKAREPRLRPVQDATNVALSADGRTVAFGNIAGTVWLWDLRRRAPAAALPIGAGRGGPGLALSADGRTLAVVSESGGIQLWDVRARRPLGQLLPGANGAGVAFSPDGRVLASTGGAVRLWKGILWRDRADLGAQVCGLVVGDLTKAEWTAIAPGVPYRTTCSR